MLALFVLLGEGDDTVILSILAACIALHNKLDCLPPAAPLPPSLPRAVAVPSIAAGHPDGVRPPQGVEAMRFGAGRPEPRCPLCDVDAEGCLLPLRILYLYFLILIFSGGSQMNIQILFPGF